VGKEGARNKELEGISLLVIVLNYEKDDIFQE